jgi:NitT/TauT family transport system substrate-binding protein
MHSRARHSAVLVAFLTVVALVLGSTTAASAKSTAKRKTTKKKKAAATTVKKKPATTTTVAVEKPTTVRLGYFPNITHAPAIVGIEGGLFADALGDNKLKTYSFNDGTAASEALLSGSIDITYMGPNPSINAYAKSKAIKVIAGATSGGALFVTSNKVISNSDLKGKNIGTPSLGNTQDVALRYFLKQNGFKTDASGGGDVSIKPQSNATSLDQFKQGQIDGAWVPEPWASRLILEGKGHIFLDEAQTWKDGQFVTTNVAVRSEFLKDHPEAVTDVLKGELAAIDLMAKEPARAKKLVDQGIRRVTGTNITDEETEAAWPRMTFTVDPVASSLKLSADHAKEIGLLPKDTDIDGIYDLRLLNRLLKAKGRPEVSGL